MNNELAKKDATPVVMDDKDITLTVLMAILHELIGLVHSHDVWALACMGAASECLNLGIPEDKVKEAISKFVKLRSNKAKRNPFSSMF